MSDKGHDFLMQAQKQLDSAAPEVREAIANEPFGPFVKLVRTKDYCEREGIKARITKMADFVRQERGAQVVMDREFILTLERLVCRA